ncbi:MAG: hypothetical protein JNJ65_16265 [Cyclobacteriaceae bacterium]|nr:hypothetical protein [Cyclobacteriaceae bacterium]
MKTLIILFLAIASVSAQTVLRVNNTPGVNAPYTTIAAAVAAAGANDVIIVEGSSIQYAGITVDKKVTIVGPGYFLNENTGIQANLFPATIDFIDLYGGASGSSISGVTTGAGLGGGVGFRVVGINNLSIIGNNTYGLQLMGSSNNILVKGNYINDVNATGCSCSNTLFVNNLVLSTVNAQNTSSTLTFANNTLLGSVQFIHYSSISNNIFYAPTNVSFWFANSTVTKNVFVATSAADATNLQGVAAASLFVGLTGNTTDTQYRLKIGSPAIGAGIGGIDCGMYGGATPYKPSGIATGQHTVNNLLVPVTVIQNGTLNVKVSAKVN